MTLVRELNSRSQVPAEKNWRVLVIDDNRAIHEDFKKILSPKEAETKRTGQLEDALFGDASDTIPAPSVRFAMDSAYHGQEGVQMVEAALAAGNPYAVAFVDIRMPPGWDGVETTRKLWALDPNLQIVICTAHSDYTWSDLFAQLGQSDGLLILKKPFDHVEAFQLAHALTEKWSLHRQSRHRLEELEAHVAERTLELQRANDALDRQKTELRALFDFTPAMICFKDTKNGILRANKKMAEILGRPVGEIEGKSTFEVLPEGAEKYYEDDLVVIRSGQPRLGIIETVRDHAGRETSIQTDKVPVFDQEGKVVGLVVMAQDITGREQAKKVLQDSKRFLQSTLDALSAHIAILDEQGAIVEVNAAWKRFTGQHGFMGNLSGVGDNYLKVCATAFESPGGEAGLIAEGIRIVMAGRRDEFHLEYPRHSPSERRWFVVRVTRFESDGSIRVVVAHENITERKQAEESLAETSALLETLLENTTDAIYFKDRESRFVHFSHKILEIFRLTLPAQLQGLTDFDFFSEEHARPAFEIEQEIIRTGQPVLNLEEKETHLDGRIKWVLTSKMPWLDKDGRVLGTMGITRDITDRKRHETQLFQSQKLETVGKLAGGIAHEFNTILTSIIGQSEGLLERLPAASAELKHATEIRQAADRASALTRQLLAYGRRQFLQPGALNLNLVIGGMNDMLRHLVGREVEIQIVPFAGLQPVLADAGQVEQVIMNLAMNAGDAMPSGGVLKLETSNITLSPEEVSRFPECKAGAYVMLSVTDTGTGMSAETQARIFEPFFTTKEVGHGTGLGLSTCYGIIKQSGGHIAVQSDPGQGATFKIYLPQVVPLKVKARLPAPPDLPHGREKILLVESDPALREMAGALLTRLGYVVLAASDGNSALVIQDQQIDGPVKVLLADIAMPHMGGKELAERVRQVSPTTRILFTSARSDGSSEQLGEGMLQKPFTPSALAHKLREVLDRP